MILTILKIIGIILLVILLIILLILALVLFVPIRYRFAGEYFEKPDVFANVRYFPVALNAQVTYKEDKLEYTIRVLGGVIMTNTGAKLSWLGRKLAPGGEDKDAGHTDSVLKDKETDAGNHAMPDRAASDVAHDNLSENVQKINATDEPDDNAQKGEKQDKNSQDIRDIKGTAPQNQNKDNTQKKKVKKQKNKGKKRPLYETAAEKLEIIKGKYRGIRDKLSQIKNKKDALLKVYHSKRFDTAKNDVIRYIKELFRSLKPKHIEGRIHFGMEDPAATGEILGGLSMILPLYESYLTINPDFEKQVIEGILKGSGNIYLWSIVKIALKVIFNKNLIKVTKKVKTIIEA